MTPVATSTLTAKGQVTIPRQVRQLLKLQQGDAVAFALTRSGVLLTRCRMVPESPFTEREWQALGKLSRVRGKRFRSAKGALRHLASL